MWLGVAALAQQMRSALRNNCHRRRGLVGAFLLLLVWSYAGALVWAAEAECVRLYRSKKLLQAANCFEALANQLKRANGTTSRQRVMRGRAIRNAASLLSRIAGNANHVARSAWLRERAIKLLQLFLQEKLYELSERRQQVTIQLYKLRRAIRYSHLTVVAHDPNASFSIQGYQMKAQGQGRWSQRVRPGSYSILQGTQRRRVALRPGQARVVVFSSHKSSAAPKAPRRTIVPWILMAVGGGLVLSGGVFLGIAEGIDQAKVQQNLELLAQPTMSAAQRREGVKQIEALQGQAQALYGVGWTILLVGVLTAAGGVVWRWWPRRPSPKKAKASQGDRLMTTPHPVSRHAPGPRRSDSTSWTPASGAAVTLWQMP